MALERHVADAEAGDPETLRAPLAIRYYIADVIAECARRSGSISPQA
jgi:hypothetical protein